MSLSCPRCGCEIVGLIPGSDPLPGWHSGVAPPVASGVASGVASAAQAQNAHVSKSFRTQDRKQRKQGYDQGFLEFWGIYPRHHDKIKAQVAYRVAIRRASQSQILAHAQAYRDDPNRRDDFTKYAATWLNATEFSEPYVPLPSRLAPGVEPARKSQTPAEIKTEIDALIRGQA